MSFAVNFLSFNINNCEPLIVTRPGNTSVVVIPLDEYNSIKETEYIMSSPEMVRRLKEAQKEMKDGIGIKINIEDL